MANATPALLWNTRGPLARSVGFFENFAKPPYRNLVEIQAIRVPSFKCLDSEELLRDTQKCFFLRHRGGLHTQHQSLFPTRNASDTYESLKYLA